MAEGEESLADFRLKDDEQNETDDERNFTCEEKKDVEVGDTCDDDEGDGESDDTEENLCASRSAEEGKNVVNDSGNEKNLNHGTEAEVLQSNGWHYRAPFRGGEI